MNHRDRETLGNLLDQLWATRNGHRERKSGIVEFETGALTMHQRELLAAAMRIVAGNTEGSELPDPWGTAPIWSAQHPRPYDESARWWQKREKTHAETTYRQWLRIFR
jgi:hypothetical protein